MKACSVRIALSSLPRIEQIYCQRSGGATGVRVIWSAVCLSPADATRKTPAGRQRFLRMQPVEDTVNIYKGLCMPADLRASLDLADLRLESVSVCSTSAFH